MKKNKYFYGKYYKFIASDGFTFAMIVAHSNEDNSIQLITNEKSYNIVDVSSISIKDDKNFIFNVKQDDLSINGEINIDKLNPLKHHVMGFFHYIPFLECRHEIYSMYHHLSGKIIFNNQTIDFTNGHGYIEGDRGVNFPSRYIWYNSSLYDNTAVTFAIANIPFGLFSFTGILAFIKTKDKEYYLSTYNFAKAELITKNHIIIKKRKYKLDVIIEENEGHHLKAPVKGNMTRYIKENVSIPSEYKLTYKDKIVVENSDPHSAFELDWR